MRQKATEIGYYQNLEQWREENPEEFQNHHKNQGLKLEEWKQNNKSEFEEVVKQRNKTLKSDSHRDKMRQKLKEYQEKDPEGEAKRREKARKTVSDKKQIRQDCVQLMGNKLAELGLTKEREVYSKKNFESWGKKGFLDQYFSDRPGPYAKLDEWLEYKKHLENSEIISI